MVSAVCPRRGVSRWQCTHLVDDRAVLHHHLQIICLLLLAVGTLLVPARRSQLKAAMTAVQQSAQLHKQVRGFGDGQAVALPPLLMSDF